MPGLHLVGGVPKNAHGFNLDFVRSFYFATVGSLACRSVGMPSPATGGEGGRDHLLKFPPFAEAGGVVLQFDVSDIASDRFCAATIVVMEDFAKRMFEGVKWLYRRRRPLALRVQEVRAAAEAGLAARPRRADAARLDRICIDARSIGRPDEPVMRVEYSGLDHALRLGVLVEVVGGRDVLDVAGLCKALVRHDRRDKLRSELRHHLADGLIDDLAAALARAAPIGASEVLDRLSRDLETSFLLPGPEGALEAKLHWRGGVIRGELTIDEGVVVASHVHSSEGEVTTVRSPPTSRATIDVVDLGRFDIVDDQRSIDRARRVEVQVGLSLTNTARGAIWAIPAALLPPGFLAGDPRLARR